MRYNYTLFQSQTSSIDDQSLFWTKENDFKDGHYFEITSFTSRGQYISLQIEPCGWQYIYLLL